MLNAIRSAALSTIALTVLAGCAQQAAPPPRVAAPPPGTGARAVDPVRPVEETYYGQDRLYEDVPIVNERPPEEAAFVQAYNAVGRPRITLFVNRTLEGQIVPTVPHDPIIAVERSRRATGGVTVERRDDTISQDRWRDDRREQIDRFQTTGPGEYTETTEVYLRPGEYDELAARRIDYDAIETQMTDALAASGNTVLMSPWMVRRTLTAEQIQALEQGRPQVLREIAQQLDTEILIQVQARATRQTPEGLHLRLVVDAFNIGDGQSIGRAVVDMPPPLEQTTINRYTRFLARKLMSDMISTWSAPPPPQAPQPEGVTLPTTQPR